MAGEECGAQGGYIFKVGNDVDMQMATGRREGDDAINGNYHHHCHQPASTRKACSVLGLL